MPVTRQQPYLAATLAGEPLAGLLDASVDLTYTRLYGEANLILTEAPDFGAEDDEVTVTMGAGGGTGPNDVVRFSGVYWEPAWQVAPGRFRLKARGRLAWLEEFHHDTPAPGMQLVDLLGATTPTDGALIAAVLDTAAFAHPALTYSPVNIGDSGIVLGTVGPEAFAWPKELAGSEYVGQIETVSIGRRLFETIGGEIYFFPIVGRPRSASDFIFTQGLDIFSGAESTRSVRQSKNYFVTRGYDPGDGQGQLVVSLQSSNDFQPVSAQFTHTVNSPMVQTQAHADALNDYWDQELNRRIVDMTFTTHRDDILGPGQTLSIIAPKLATTEPVFLLGVNISVQGSPRRVFRQRLRVRGGGPPLDDPSPPV